MAAYRRFSAVGVERVGSGIQALLYVLGAILLLTSAVALGPFGALVWPFAIFAAWRALVNTQRARTGRF